VTDREPLDELLDREMMHEATGRPVMSRIAAIDRLPSREARDRLLPSVPESD